MGRELRRVPLDFDWPLNKVWGGFLNDKHQPCPEEGRSCFNGYTGGARWLESIVRMLMIVAEEGIDIRSADDMERRSVSEYQSRKRIYPHPYLQAMPTAHTFLEPGKKIDDLGSYLLVPPTDDLADLVASFVGKSRTEMFGHLGADGYDFNKRLIKMAGMPKGWGICQVCKGECVDPAAREAYDAWEETPPPEGEGYQLWETTSEGSPVSPVFKALDELCAWCETNATTFGSFKTTASEWKRMLDDGFVCHKEGEWVFV